MQQQLLWPTSGMHRTRLVGRCGWAGHRWECTGLAPSVVAVGLDIVGNAPDMPRPSMLYARYPKRLRCHRHVHACPTDHFFDVVKKGTITRSPKMTMNLRNMLGTVEKWLV